MYAGECQGPGVRTDFEMVHLRKVPGQYRHLSGLLDIFKSKMVSGGPSCSWPEVFHPSSGVYWFTFTPNLRSAASLSLPPGLPPNPAAPRQHRHPLHLRPAGLATVLLAPAASWYVPWSPPRGRRSSHQHSATLTPRWSGVTLRKRGRGASCCREGQTQQGVLLCNTRVKGGSRTCNYPLPAPLNGAGN